ncbi:translation initiation factor IF-2-like [Hylaeus anthracinus]|uniref:translation initiation factor IF-2-like n=1 Tax=Hylaeus anthracinus TaxID=313031 RepID=UPI0023BA227F|nr:translation initiation factor IF-2-like [Hylaeus anthracinus]
MTMDNRGLSVYGAEGVASLSTGAVKSSRPGYLASLSYDWENPRVDHQAPGLSNAPGEETSVAGTSSAAASSGVSPSSGWRGCSAPAASWRLQTRPALALTATGQSARSCKPLKGEEELAAEMRHAPTAELGSRIFESSEAVLRVAKCSNKLQGPMVRQLRIAADTIRHATVEQAKRVKTLAREVELEQTVAELRARVTELGARLAHGPVAPAAVPSLPSPVDPAISVPVPPSRPSASSTTRSSRPAASRPAPAGPSRKPAMGGATLAPDVDVEGLIRRLCGEMEVRLAAHLGAVSLVAAASGAPRRVPRATQRPPAGPSQPAPSAVGSHPWTVSGEPAKKKTGRKRSEKKQAGGAAAHLAPALPGRDRPRAAPAPAASRASLRRALPDPSGP